MCRRAECHPAEETRAVPSESLRALRVVHSRLVVWHVEKEDCRVWELLLEIAGRVGKNLRVQPGDWWLVCEGQSSSSAAARSVCMLKTVCLYCIRNCVWTGARI